MGIGQVGGAWRPLRALFEAGTTTGLTDTELLERYTVKRAKSAEAAAAAESAFATLVDRHGAMVWGVCHRVLGDTHEAEDAFQATFLVLVRKAGSVRVNGSLGRWLYGVAHRVSLRSRSQAAHRRTAIEGIPSPSADDRAGDVELSELRAVVGEEVDALPAKYRCPVELCHLQGMTYDQAARQLNWPVATVKNRLRKGRLRLRAKLARRGLAPGVVAAGLTTLLTNESRAAIPAKLIHSTARAATASSACAFSCAVTDLTQRTIKVMRWEKLKLVAAGAVAAFGLGLTTHAVSQRAPSGGLLAPPSLQSGSRPRQKTNESNMRDQRFTRSLPSGATIEIIGVSSVPSGPDTWHRPDGTPLHPAPCDRIDDGITSDNCIKRLVVARLSRIPPGADEQWSIIESRGGKLVPAKREGETVAGLFCATAAIPADAGICTARFKVAFGPWNINQTKWHYAGSGGTEDGANYILGDAVATAKGTSLLFIYNIENWPVRLVAIDLAGVECPGVISSALDGGFWRQINFEFDTPPDQIKDYRLEARPYYEQVEITGVALERVKPD